MDNTTNSSGGGNDTFSNSTFTGSTPPREPRTWWSVFLPLAYVVILIGSLYTVAALYQKRKLARSSQLELWFPSHSTRDIYLSLLHLDPTDAASGGSDEKKLNRVPDSVLKAALLRRAVEDIQRIVQIRAQKPALQALLQRGSVGDELWQRFVRAEREMEEEIKDVVSEANAFAPEWGQTIFQSANEINQNLIIKQRTAEIQDRLAGEREWWDGRRKGIEEGFMRELEADGKPADGAPATVTRKAGSDDDAVLVEAGGPAQAQGGDGAGKKKKGAKK